jgi:hypothetical protein
MAEEGYCAELKNVIHAHILQRNPNATVNIISNGSKFDDFRHFVAAPILYIDPSSFGMVAALASRSIIHAPAKVGFFLNHNISGFMWSQAPILFPSVAHSLGVNCSRPCYAHLLSAESIKKMIDWVVAN